MNYELKLSWKYFRARRKSLARLTSAVAVAGIAAGVAALLIGQAISRGFTAEMREKILEHTAHVAVFRRDGAAIDDWEKFKTNLEKPENVRAVEATIYESALIVGEKTTSYAVLRATIKNADESFFNETRITDNGQNNRQTILTSDEQSTISEKSIIRIAIGDELARKTGLQIGDEADIVLPKENSPPRTVRAVVSDFLKTGLFDYDSTWIYLTPEDFAALSGRKNFAPTVLNISLEDVFAANETANEIRRNLSEDFKVLDWQEANQPLFAALSLERKVSFVIISLVIFIAALNITTTLALLVNERRLDIAILRTCGAQTRSILFIFLFEGLLLGATGTLVGLFAGLALCAAANRFHLISLPAEIYSLSTLTLRPQIFDVLSIVAAALLLSLAATVYPAYRAARLKPLENLRNQ